MKQLDLSSLILTLLLRKANTTASSLKKGNTIAFKFRESSHHSIADYDYKSLAVDINVSSPIGLSEFWESEPMWTCKNINSIHDQGRRYHYLDDRRSK